MAKLKPPTEPITRPQADAFLAALTRQYEAQLAFDKATYDVHVDMDDMDSTKERAKWSEVELRAANAAVDAAEKLINHPSPESRRQKIYSAMRHGGLSPHAADIIVGLQDRVARLEKRLAAALPPTPETP
jgi:hypothetical protein